MFYAGSSAGKIVAESRGAHQVATVTLRAVRPLWIVSLFHQGISTVELTTN